MGALADDASRLLTALRIPRALVYGLSMGGMVALEVALRHAGRVQRARARRDLAGRPVRAAARAARRSLSMARGGIAERSLRAPLLFSAAFRREHPERVSELVAVLQAPPQLARDDRDPDAGRRAQFATTLQLGRVRAPTLVMHGERDELVPLAAGRLLAARIPDAELAVVPGSRARVRPRSPAGVARPAARLVRAPAVPFPPQRGSPCGA